MVEGWGMAWGYRQLPIAGIPQPRVSHYFPNVETAGERSLCGKWSVGTWNRYLIKNGFKIPECTPRCKLCQRKLEKQHRRDGE